MKTFHLTTIAFSHYNEKARWGLDYFGIPYKESAYMPMLHFPAAAWNSRFRGKDDRQSTRFSTPILRTDRNEIICDSSDILHYLSERFGKNETVLFPNQEATRQERQWSEALAARTRSYAYATCLGDLSLIKDVAEKNVGSVQAKLFSAFAPIFAGMIRKGLGIRSDTDKWALNEIMSEWTKAAALLSDGRPFLAGNRFTAADISFACAAVPVLLVSQTEGYSAYLPPLDRIPQTVRETALELRDTVPGKHVLKVFKNHRSHL